MISILLQVNKMFPIILLPNQDGFKFVGIGKDNNLYQCVVKQNANGCHSIHLAQDGTSFYSHLKGWKRI